MLLCYLKKEYVQLFKLANRGAKLPSSLDKIFVYIPANVQHVVDTSTYPKEEMSVGDQDNPNGRKVNKNHKISAALLDKIFHIHYTFLQAEELYHWDLFHDP